MAGGKSLNIKRFTDSLFADFLEHVQNWLGQNLMLYGNRGTKM